jgi:hypothetical protein
VRPETMKSDLVPCYYTGQDYRREQPADLLPRHEVRKYKDQRLGKFIASGRFFLFFARRVVRVLRTVWEGRPSSQSILAFLKTNSYGDKLHYEIPMAGDRGTFARHRRRSYFAARICKGESCDCHGCKIPA